MAFLAHDQYGALLKNYLYGKTKASLSALFALQGFFHKIGFPLGDKGVAKLYTIFNQFYEDDIITEEPLQEWRNDIRNPTLGHSAALAQTQQCVGKQFSLVTSLEEESCPPLLNTPLHTTLFFVSWAGFLNG